MLSSQQFCSQKKIASYFKSLKWIQKYFVKKQKNIELKWKDFYFAGLRIWIFSFQVILINFVFSKYKFVTPGAILSAKCEWHLLSAKFSSAASPIIQAFSMINYVAKCKTKRDPSGKLSSLLTFQCVKKVWFSQKPPNKIQWADTQWSKQPKAWK